MPSTDLVLIRAYNSVVRYLYSYALPTYMYLSFLGRCLRAIREGA